MRFHIENSVSNKMDRQMRETLMCYWTTGIHIRILVTLSKLNVVILAQLTLSQLPRIKTNSRKYFSHKVSDGF